MNRSWRRPTRKSENDRPEEVPDSYGPITGAWWKEGLLEGETELVVENDSPVPQVLAMAPWSPAIVVDRPRAAGIDDSPLVSTSDGRIFAWIDFEGQRSVHFSWRERPKPGADGRSFQFGLPRVDPSLLSLNLPAQFEPEGPEGSRLGPLESESGRTSSDPRAGTPAPRLWKFQGSGGATTIRLRELESVLPNPTPARVWVGGPTRIDLDDSIARWVADWTIDPGASGPRGLVVELDQGLDLVDVSGPAVLAFQAYTENSLPLLKIRLAADVSGPTPVTIRGVARAPSEGKWSVPSARLRNATWTNGKTIVRIAPERTLVGLKEISARRVPARPDDSAGLPTTGLLVVFEPSSPRSVAELELGRPLTDASAAISGIVRISPSRRPTFLATISWIVNRSNAYSPSIELPEGWVVEQITLHENQQSVLWQADPRQGGGTLVQLASMRVQGSKPLVVDLSASATGLGGLGSISLPRVRAGSVRMIDEVWTLQTEKGLVVEPTLARGVCWLDPGVSLAQEPLAAAALAWRWLEDDAKAQIDLSFAKPRLAARTLSSLNVREGRIDVDIRIRLSGVEPGAKTFPIGIDSESLDHDPTWVMARGTGVPLPSRRIDPDHHADFGLTAGGQAWTIEPPPLTSGEFEVSTRFSLAWTGEGKLPIVKLPRSMENTGLVLVEVDPAIRTSARSTGLLSLDADVARSASSAWPSSQTTTAKLGGSHSSSSRLAYAFAVGSHETSLELRTSPLENGSAGGVIVEAVLSSHHSTEARGEERLGLIIERGTAKELSVVPPLGSTLQRFEVDGRQIAPALSGRAYVIDLASNRTGGPTRLVEMVYSTPTLPISKASWFGEARAGETWPTFSLPCLTYTWESPLESPSAFSDQGKATSSLESSRSIWQRKAWAWKNASAVPGEARLLSDWTPQTLGEWEKNGRLGMFLQILDGGPTAVIIDRPALAEIGIRPDSPLSLGSIKRKAFVDKFSLLANLGLEVADLSNCFLITSKRAARALDASEGSRSASEALVRGQDSLDRYQTLHRWLGEIPTHSNANGTSTTDESSIRRRSARIEAPAWPGAENQLVWTGGGDVSKRGASAAFGVIAAALLLVRRSAALKFSLFSLVSVAAIVVSVWAPTSYSPIARGLFSGVLAGSAYWLGASRTSRSQRRSNSIGSNLSEGGSPRGRGSWSGGGALAGGAVLFIALFSSDVLIRAEDRPAPNSRVESGQSPEEGSTRRTGRVVVAVFPYEGEPDPEKPGDRVVIKLKDFELLSELANTAESTNAPPVVCHEAMHQLVGLSNRDMNELKVITHLELECVEDKGDWFIPIDRARDVSATVDGRPAPVKIEPGGETARIAVPGVGRHALEVQRWIPVRTIDGRSRTHFNVNPAPGPRSRSTPTPRPGPPFPRRRAPSRRSQSPELGGSTWEERRKSSSSGGTEERGNLISPRPNRKGQASRPSCSGTPSPREIGCEEGLRIAIQACFR